MPPVVEPEFDAPYTSGNEVKDLVDGKEFMGDLREAILKLDKDDFVLIAGWEFWQYRALDKRVITKNPRVDNYFLTGALADAVKKQANVRVLAFDNIIPGIKDRMKNFLDSVSRLSKVKVSACLDKPSNFAVSHHQKEVVIGRSNFKDSRAYVGGMDLAVDRWDDNHHNRALIEARGRNYGWHDIQVVVQGPAVLQLWANFAERWKDVQRRRPKLLPCPVPAWDWNTWANRPKMGNKHVQVLRTIAPASAGNPMRFMTNGERSVLCGLKKAIEKAECYIYIEEQFLWDCELADLVGAQMQARPNLRLIIVMTAGCELPWVAGDHAFYLRSEFFRKAMRVSTKWDIAFGATSRVYPYGLFQAKDGDGLGKAIYVHSKLIIIDDRYVAIGSANVDERSMHIETELTVGIVDGDTRTSYLGGAKTTVCKFAMNLRDRLWREHLGVKSNDISFPADPVDVLNKHFPGIDRKAPDTNAWPTTQDDAKREQKHHLRCYINIHGKYLGVAAGRHLLDRNVRKFSPVSGP